MKQKQSFEFEALKWVIGPHYYRKRDEWLATTPGVREFLQVQRQNRDWRTSITAEILLGWLDHRLEYDALELELDKVEWEQIGMTVAGPHLAWDHYAGRASANQEEGGDPKFGERILPRCWEVLLKDPLAAVRWGKSSTTREEENVYAKVHTYHAMLGGRPDPRSIEPLMWFMLNVDPRLAAFRLQAFPTELVNSRIARLLVDQKAVFEALEQHLKPDVLPPRRGGKPIEVPEEDAKLTRAVVQEPEGEAPVEPPFELEALAWISGALFTRHRDAWLATTPDARRVLMRNQGARSWRTAITATSLLGWLDHRGEYEALLRELDGVAWDELDTQPGGRERVWDSFAKRVRENPQLGEQILPLAWEVILGHHPEWRHGTKGAFFEMAREHPDERSIEPLFWFLQNVARDQTERDLAARVLARMPAEPLKRRVAQLRIDQWAILWALRRMDEKFLPNGDERHFLENFPGP